MTTSEAIKHYRRKSKMTQKEAAKQIGVSVVTFSNWESGHVIPRFYNMIKLTKLFDVSLSVFTGD